MHPFFQFSDWFWMASNQRFVTSTGAGVETFAVFNNFNPLFYQRFSGVVHKSKVIKGCSEIGHFSCFIRPLFIEWILYGCKSGKPLEPIQWNCVCFGIVCGSVSVSENCLNMPCFFLKNVQLFWLWINNISHIRPIFLEMICLILITV